jgi:hypothetical protein
MIAMPIEPTIIERYLSIEETYAREGQWTIDD